MTARYFMGTANDLGHVSALPCTTWEELVESVLTQPIPLGVTRGAFHALPAKQKAVTKRTDYIVPAVFVSSPCRRQSEHATHCNLLALDVDDALQAGRLLTQRLLSWDDALPGLDFIVWHTASSTPEFPRLRVMVSAEGIAPHHYAQAVRSVAEMLGLTQVTHESLVPVQPMFLPVAFEGDEGSPIVYVRTGAAPFRMQDAVVEDITSPRHREPNAGDPDAVASGQDSNAVEDITYLRSPMEDVSLADVEDALGHLDPDCPMQQWIEIAAGIKHQFAGRPGVINGETKTAEEMEQEAYQLWDTWSAKGQKYVDDHETEYRWSTLKAAPADREPVTIRSVFRLAAARGWSNPTLMRRTYLATLAWLQDKGRSTEELFDQGTQRIAKAGPALGTLERKALIQALRAGLAERGMKVALPDLKKEVHRLETEAQRKTGVPPWTKGLCYVTALNLFYRYTVDRWFAPEVIDLIYQVPRVGDEQPPRARDYLIQTIGIQQVENIRYEPARQGKRFFEDEGRPYLNTYRGGYAVPEPSRAQAAGEIFQEHVRNLIAEEEYQIRLIDFLAWHVQHPGKKIRWATLIQSAPGAGKTFLAVAAAVVLGRRNVRKVAAANVLDSQYNDWAAGSQLVVMEEVRVIGHNRHAVMDKLKPLISDDEISVNQKYEDHRTIPNVTNYLLFTNYHDSLAVRDDDRRYFVLSSPIQTPAQIEALGGAAYYARIFNMLRDNPGGLRSWFESWPISSDFQPDGRAPRTSYLIELASTGASPLAAAVQEAIEESWHPLVCSEMVSLQALRDCLDKDSLPRFTDQTLVGVLKEAGWLRCTRLRVGGERHRLWTKTLLEPAELSARAEALLAQRKVAGWELV